MAAAMHQPVTPAAVQQPVSPSTLEEGEQPAGNLGECFVCQDDDNLAPLSPCKCKKRYAHPACIEHMACALGKTSCPVCLSEYEGLAAGKRVVHVLSPKAKWCLVTWTGSILMAGCIIYLAVETSIRSHWALQLSILVFFVIWLASTLIGIYVGWLMHRSQEKFFVAHSQVFHAKFLAVKV